MTLGQGVAFVMLNKCVKCVKFHNFSFDTLEVVAKAKKITSHKPPPTMATTGSLQYRYLNFLSKGLGLVKLQWNPVYYH